MAASASAVPPAGDFTVSPNPPNEDQAATFTCNPCPEGADVAWDFDGNLDFADATGASVQHIFADAGLVTVRMRLSQDAEETVVPHDFTVNARPTVSFDFLPVSPLPGEPVGFNQVIGDPDGDALTWQWRFGDGTTSTLEDPQHAYATPGTRTVELEVSDARGARTTDTRQVTIQDPNGPTANFTFSPAVPLGGAVVTFTNTSTPSAGQSITGAAWDLDNDGEFDDSPAGWSFGIPGNHAVSVRVTQSNGKQAVKQRNIRVNAPPTAAFVWSPSTPITNESVDLISTSTDAEGPLAAQDWELDGDDDFNDATGPSVTRAFPAGTHTVKLRVRDSDGVVRTVTRQLSVLGLPTANFTFSPTVPLVGQALTFTNTSTASSGQAITGAVWDLDDDGQFDDNPAGWSFSTPGSRRISLKVTQTNGQTAGKQLSIRVNAPPTAAFTWSPLAPIGNQPVDLISTSTDAEGPLAAHAWDLDGDGQFGDGTGPNVTRAFPAGTHTVKLRVTDSDGVVRTITRQVTVLDLPNAAFNVSPGVPLVGEVLTFANTSTASSGSLTQAVWDLDDDDQFDDNPAGWSFSARGNHRVSLKVTQTNGKTAVKELDIRVNAAPAVAFVWSPLTPVAGQATDLVSISSDSEGVLSGQAWDLDGDGQFDDASGSAVSRAFPSAGTYDVGLQVTDSDGIVRTIRQAVTVSAAPILPAANERDEPRFIAPFPVIRLAGNFLSRGAFVRLLVVRAPRGALIRVGCEGTGCPVEAARRKSTDGSVRFPQFERRLRAGIRLEIFVRQPGRIGKYTRFRVRAGEPPKRTDRCLFPGVQRPKACP